MGPVLFFGTSDELPSERIRREARAKLFCARCDVLGDCLLEGQEEEGIWGGQTEAERRRARRVVLPSPTAPLVVRASHPQAESWVVLETRDKVTLYRCDDPESWHGSAFLVVKHGTVTHRTYDLADAYTAFNRLLG